MAAPSFRVIFTESAWRDLEEIAEYWSSRSDPERGAQYAHDLPSEAIRQLSKSNVARAGRFLRHTSHPTVQEFPVFKRSYRILYRVNESERVVEVLRFWHSHRDEPFQT